MIYFSTRKLPLILGEYDDNIDFTFEADIPVATAPWEVYGACAASLNNEMWLIGGDLPEQRRKVIFSTFEGIFESSYHISDTKSVKLCIGKRWTT